MAAGIAEVLERIEHRETRKAVEGDAAQSAEQLLQLLPVCLLDFGGKGLTRSQFICAAEEIGAKLPFPDRLDRKTEGPPCFEVNPFHVGLCENGTRPVAAIQFVDLGIERDERRHDDILIVGFDRHIVLARLHVSEAVFPPERAHGRCPRLAASAI